MLDLTNYVNEYGVRFIREVPERERSFKEKSWYCLCVCGKTMQVRTKGRHYKKSCGCHRDLKQGERFGRLTVQYKTKKKSKGKDQKPLYKCTCECGGVRYTTADILKAGDSKSCGCLNDKLKPQDRFGELTVLEKTDKKTKNGIVYWKCLCDCGNHTLQIASSLTSGNVKTCGCGRFSDIRGKRFGRLTAIKPTGDIIKGRGVIWQCVCDCGNCTEATAGNLNAGNKTSCGCKGISRGEMRIKSFLDEKKLLYKSEYSFPELYSITEKAPLRYDFAILNDVGELLYLIEYDGAQHFQAYEYFGGEAKFEKVKKNDELKNEYCRKNGIPLIRIPYWDFDNIEEILEDTVFEC